MNKPVIILEHGGRRRPDLFANNPVPVLQVPAGEEGGVEAFQTSKSRGRRRRMGRRRRRMMIMRRREKVLSSKKKLNNHIVNIHKLPTS